MDNGHISRLRLGGSPTTPKTEVRPMCPMTRDPMLPSVFSPFRRSQHKTHALIMAAVAGVAPATSLALAAHRASAGGMQLGSAPTRLSRRLRDERSAAELLPAQLLQVPCRGFRRVSWLLHCQELRQAFVVRLVSDLMVDTGTTGRRL